MSFLGVWACANSMVADFSSRRESPLCPRQGCLMGS